MDSAPRGRYWSTTRQPISSGVQFVPRPEPKIHGHVDWMPATYYGAVNWIPDPSKRALVELALHLKWPPGKPTPPGMKLAPVSAMAMAPSRSTRGVPGAMLLHSSNELERDRPRQKKSSGQWRL